jgi:hypothetical protein
MIVQMTRTRDELFILKEMLPIWMKYADGFVFQLDTCADGTYEYLMENKEKYNILSVIQATKNHEKLEVESDERQILFDEAYKFSKKLICLDTDEYLDGTMTKHELESILDQHTDTMFYLSWIQYTGKNKIRVDGKWANHPVDRLASYSTRCIFKPKQMHSEHIPAPNKVAHINPPHLFVAHLQWLDKKSVAIKQYFWKVVDYVNKLRYSADVIDVKEYDNSVSNFVWTEIDIPFPLKVDADIYQRQNPLEGYKYRFIQENIAKYNIPNLNDWGMGIHQS